MKNQQGIKWSSPTPLWGEHSSWVRLPKQAILHKPVILRFANDDFMEEFLAMLTHCPWRITDWIAQPETWREPMQNPKPILKTRPQPNILGLYNKTKLLLQKESTRKNALITYTNNATVPSFNVGDITAEVPPLKLFQPAHQRYYLVSSSLITEQAAYPDYGLNLTYNERASFVVRALVLNEDNELNEHAFVSTPNGMAWQEVAPHKVNNVANKKLVPGEEQLPLFPVNYRDQCGRSRQILNGMIPVGKREEWMAAPASSKAIPQNIAYSVPSEEGGITHLKEIFQADVVEPWKSLIEQAQLFKGTIPENDLVNPSPNFSDMWEKGTSKAKLDKVKAIKTCRDQIQLGSWYVLLDFANFLEKYLNNIWKKIVGEPGSDDKFSDSEENFVNLLSQTFIPSQFYFELAIENLAIAKTSFTPVYETLWDEFLDLWKLEKHLELEAWPEDIGDYQNLVKDILGRVEVGEAVIDFGFDMQKVFEYALTLEGSGYWYTKLDLFRHIEQNIPNIRKYALGSITLSELKQLAGEYYIYSRLNATVPDVSNINSDLFQISIVGELGLNKGDIDDFEIDTTGAAKKISIVHSLRDALVKIKDYEADLESMETAYERATKPADEPKPPVSDQIKHWPNFLFPLADPEPALAPLDSAIVPPLEESSLDEFEGAELLYATLDALVELVDSLIPKPDEESGQAFLSNPKPLLDQRKARFVIRCVFQRPNCHPFFPDLVSGATRQFELAPFFEPDAPARPVRIPLPVDISPAGLRKYKKNTMFLISDMLCGKIKKIRKLTLGDLVLSVLPWPFHKDLPKAGPTGPCQRGGSSFGMWCSLSIPIVTLCALILLIIMVNLFDLFFHWIPFLFTCFPIPGLKGKGK